MPLTGAGKIGRVLPVYVIEPEVIEATDFDALHWDFIRESLIDLNSSLEELGVSLLVQIGEVCDVFKRLHQQFGFTKIFAHEETGNALSYSRDRRLAKWAHSAELRSKKRRKTELSVVSKIVTAGRRSGVADESANYIARQ